LAPVCARLRPFAIGPPSGEKRLGEWQAAAHRALGRSSGALTLLSIDSVYLRSSDVKRRETIQAVFYAEGDMDELS